MPSWDVIYRAVADFSDLTSKAEKAKLSLKELEAASNKTSDAEAKGAAKAAAANELDAKAIKSRGDAMEKAAAQAALYNKAVNNGGASSASEYISNLQREQQAQTLLERARQRGFQTPQQNYAFKQQELSQQNLLNRANWAGYTTPQQYLQYLNQLRKSMDDENTSLARHTSLINEAQQAATSHSKSLKGLQGQSGIFGSQIASVQAYADALNALPDDVSTDAKFNDSKATQTVLGFKSLLDTIPDTLRAKLQLDDTGLDETLAEDKLKLDAFGNVISSPDVELDDHGFSDHINSLKAQMEDLAKQVANPQAKLNISDFQAKMAEIKAEIEELKKQSATIDVTDKVNTRQIAQAEKTFADLAARGNAAFNSISHSADRAYDDIDSRSESSSTHTIGTWSRIRGSLGGVFSDFRKSADDAMSDVESRSNRSSDNVSGFWRVTGHFLRGVFHDFDIAGRDAATDTEKVFRRAGETIGESVKDGSRRAYEAFDGLVDKFEKGGKRVVASLGPMGAAIGAVIAILPQLATAAQAAGSSLAALPAFMFAGGLAAGVLVKSFSHVKTALGDFTKVANGGAKAQEAFNKSLDGLPEPAQRAIKALEPFITFWQKNTSITTRFFQAVDPGLNHLAQDVIPPVKKSLDAMATSLGGVFAKALHALGAFTQSRDWTILSQNSVQIVSKLGDAAVRVAVGFQHIAAAAAPFATWLSTDIDNVAKKFENWAQQQDKAGSQLKRWLTFAKEAFHGLDVVLKGVVDMFEIIGGATPKFNAQGQLTGIIPSDNQNKQMQSFVQLMQTLGKVVLPDLGLAFRSLSELSPDVAGSVVKLLGAVTRLVTTVVSAPGFQVALSLTLKFITGIADVLTDVAKWKPAGDIIGGILGVFTALAVLKFTGIFALLEKIKSVGPLISKLTGGKFGWSLSDPSDKITAAGKTAGESMSAGIKEGGDAAAAAMRDAIAGGGKVAGAEEAEGEAAGGKVAGVEEGVGEDTGGAAAGGGGILSKLLGKLGGGGAAAGEGGILSKLLSKLAPAGAGAGLEEGGLAGLGGAAGGVGLGIFGGLQLNKLTQEGLNKLNIGKNNLGKDAKKFDLFPTSLLNVLKDMGSGKTFEDIFKKVYPFFQRDVIDPIGKWISGPFVRFWTNTIPRWFGTAWTFFDRDVVHPITKWVTGDLAHFFTSTIPAWFRPVTSFFSRDVIKPISNFATKTLPHFFTTTIPQWFKDASGFFSRDVIKPIENFATKTLPHFFTSTVPSWFHSVSGVFSRDVIKPIENFATKTLPHFFTQTIPQWFKAASGFFSRDVIKPIENFVTKSIPHFFTTTIPQWFKSANTFFNRDVVKPVEGFVTKSIPAFFTKTIPGWFKSANTWLNRDVVKPVEGFVKTSIPNFFDKSIPHWFKDAVQFLNRDVVRPVEGFVKTSIPNFFDKSIPRWFKAASSWFSRDVISPVRRFVTSTIPGFFTSTIPRWFNIATHWFSKDVEDPLRKFIRTSIPGFFTSTIPHWFSGVWSWFTKDVVNPITHFFSSLPSKIGSFFKSAGSGVLHGIEHFLGLKSGGPVPGYASGSSITDHGGARKSGSIPGAGEHDNQLIMAQPGEFMIRKGARMALDQKFGPNFLNAVNHADMPGMLKQNVAEQQKRQQANQHAAGGIIGYAAGGAVGGATSINTSAIIESFIKNVERPINTYVIQTLPQEFKRSGNSWFSQMTADFNKQSSGLTKFINTTVNADWNSSIKKWFDSVPKEFTKNVEDPIKKFANNTIQGNWNTSVTKWFDSANNQFKKNVIEPIQKFASSSVQSTWNNSINKWFDSATNLFRKNVINPIQQFAANSVQSTWNNSINKWFDSASNLFRKNVINPIQQFAGNSVQSTWNNSINKWFDSVGASFRKNVINPIQQFAANSVQSTWNNSVNRWFDSAWGSFKKDVSDPINNFASHTIQSWWNASANGWFNSVWGKFKSQFTDPLNGFISHTIENWWNSSIGGWFNSVWGAFTSQFTSKVHDFISNTIESWWNSSVPGWFNNVWSTFGHQVATPMHGYISQTVPHLWSDSSAHWFSGVFNHFKTQVANPIKSWFSSDLPHAIESAFKTSINYVISNVINKVIVFINDIGKKAGIAAISKVQTLAGGGGVDHQFMKLGPGSVGGAGDHDTQPILATPGEFVVRKGARQAIDRTFGPDMMNQINNADRVLGFAGGGKIPPSYIENGMAFADGGSVPKNKPKKAGSSGAISGSTIAQYAEGFKGHRYVLGGSGDYQKDHNPPFGAWDCAGFVSQMYEHFGIGLGKLGSPNVSVMDAWAKNVHSHTPTVGGMAYFVGADGTRTHPGHIGMVTGPNKSIQAMDEALGTRDSDLSGALWFNTPPNGFVGGGDGSITFGKAAFTDFDRVFGAEGSQISQDAKKKTGLTFDKLMAETVAPLIAAKLPPGSFSANTGRLMIKDIQAVADKEIAAKEATLGGSGGFYGAGGTAVYTYLLNNIFNGKTIPATGALASIWGESGWNPDSQGTGGRGLIGWTPPSKLPNSAFTGNKTKDMAAQLPLIKKFIQDNPPDTSRVQAMMSAKTVEEAANEWGVGIERFGVNDVHSAGIAAAKAIAASVAKSGNKPSNPAKGTPTGKGPQSPANAKHLASGGPVLNAVDATTGEAATREAMLLGSYLTSEWNTGFHSGSQYGPFGITIGGTDKITAAQAQNPLWAAKHMLPKYQAGVAKYGSKSEPYNAEQAAAQAEGGKSFYSSKGTGAVKSAWTKVLALLGVKANQSSAGGAPSSKAGSSQAGDPSGNFSTVATGTAAQDKTWSAAAPALLKDIGAEVKAYNTLIGHKPKSNTTAYKNGIAAIKATHPVMVSAYEALSGGWGKQIPRYLPGMKGTGGSSVNGVLIHTKAQQMWKALENSSSAHVSALTKNATGLKSQAPDDYAAELAQAKAMAAESKAAYAAWIMDRSQPQTANKTLAYANAIKTLLADYTAEAKTYNALFTHGAVTYKNVTTGTGKSKKTTAKKSNADAEQTKRWTTYAMPALRTWHANLATRDAQLAGDPTDGTVDVTNDLLRFNSSIAAGQSVIKTHPILAELAPVDTKAEVAALSKMAADYATTYAAWQKFNGSLPHQVGSATPGPAAAPPSVVVPAVNVMSLVQGGPAAASFAAGGMIPSPFHLPDELLHGAKNGTQFLRENKAGTFSDVAKMFALGGPVPAGFSSMPESVGTSGMQHLATGGPVRQLSDAAEASAGNQSSPFMTGDIHVHNPVREKAGESVTRNVQRLALLAGRGIA